MKKRDTIISNRAIKARNIAFGTLTYAVLIVIAIATVFPFLYMFFSGFKSSEEIRQFSDVFYLIPKQFSTWGYEKLFSFNPNQFSFIRGFLNTLLVEAAFIFVGLYVGVATAYGFAVIDFKGRNAVLIACLIGPPFVVTLMPQYAMFSKLGLVGTFWPLVIPHFFGTMGVVFYLERYMKSLPPALFEAATVDGIGHFGKIFKIAFPLSKPAVIVQVVFTFLGIWNNLLESDIYLTRVQDKTLQVMLMGLNNAVQSGRASDQPIIMAAATLSSLPVLILYLLSQKYIVNAMAGAAVKG